MGGGVSSAVTLAAGTIRCRWIIFYRAQSSIGTGKSFGTYSPYAGCITKRSPTALGKIAVRGEALPGKSCSSFRPGSGLSYGGGINGVFMAGLQLAALAVPVSASDNRKGLNCPG